MVSLAGVGGGAQKQLEDCRFRGTGRKKEEREWTKMEHLNDELIRFAATLVNITPCEAIFAVCCNICMWHFWLPENADISE